MGARAGRIAAALRWTGAPVTLGAAAVLALNDHVLKQAWPGLVTGKLSDVAGLLVAPPLLALVLAAAGARRPAVPAVLLTGACFAWVKLTVTGAGAVSDLADLVAGPSVVRRDPSDLLALPALLLAWRVHRLAGERQPRGRRLAAALGALALPGALVTVAATGACNANQPSVANVLAVQGQLSGAPGTARRLLVQVPFSGAYLVVGADGRLTPLPFADASRVRSRSPSARSVCLPGRHEECWRADDPRPGRAGVAVQHTTDGGRSWTTEIPLGPAAWAHLQRDAVDGCGSPPLVQVLDLAALRTGRGTLVAVAAQDAGLLLRLPDGHWRRTPASALPAAAGQVAPSPRHPVTAGVLRDLTVPAPSPTPTPSPSPSLPCSSPTLVTVTPDPRNGGPTSYPVCPGTS